MSTWDILQIFLVLGLMVIFMYGLLFIVKKYFYSFEKRSASGNKINIISTQAIMPKRFLSIIEFNNKVYMVGVTDQSINLIDKIDSDSIGQIDKKNEEVEKLNFLTLLKNNMGMK